MRTPPLNLIFGVFLLASFSSLPAYSAEGDSEEPSPAMRDTRVPVYSTTRPSWAFQLASSLKAFGGSAYAASILAEYQPPFVQDFGVLGIGPCIGVYPLMDSTVTANMLAVWSVGGQIRYQARYFRQQPIVPIVGYEIERLTYAFNSGVKGTINGSGPVFGLWLYLNFLEPSAAADLYVNTGISRSYLIFEMRNLSGSDANIQYTGITNYFGFRLEL